MSGTSHQHKIRLSKLRLRRACCDPRIVSVLPRHGSRETMCMRDLLARMKRWPQCSVALTAAAGYAEACPIRWALVVSLNAS